VFLLSPGVADAHRSVVGVDDVRIEYHANRRRRTKAGGTRPSEATSRPSSAARCAVLRWKMPSSRCKGDGRALADDHLRISPGPAERRDRSGGLAATALLLGECQAASGSCPCGLFLADVNRDEQREAASRVARCLGGNSTSSPRRPTPPSRLGKSCVSSVRSISSEPAPTVLVAILGNRRLPGNVARGRVDRLRQYPPRQLRLEQHALLRSNFSLVCRRDASRASACDVLAAPVARAPSAAPPTTARPVLSAPPDRRAQCGVVWAGVRHASCYARATHLVRRFSKLFQPGFWYLLPFHARRVDAQSSKDNSCAETSTLAPADRRRRNRTCLLPDAGNRGEAIVSTEQLQRRPAAAEYEEVAESGSYPSRRAKRPAIETLSHIGGWVQK